MKKAIILGVGNPQVDAIRFLKERGFHVIGVGYRREGRGLDLVDEFAQLDIRDREGILALARREQVSLVYSVGSSLATLTAAAVSRELGLPTLVEPATAALLHDKLGFRRQLATWGISPVEFREVRGKADVADFIRYPAMLKPADSQGQRGVFLCASADELRRLVPLALMHSDSGTLILEEYLDGPEISVHVLLAGGVVRNFVVSDRLPATPTAPAAAAGDAQATLTGIAAAHVLPSRACTGALLAETRDLVQRCIEAFGLRDGPLYVQLKLTSRGPRIIEATPRLDGCHLWRLVRDVTGVDLLDATFRLLLGDAVEAPDGVPQAPPAARPEQPATGEAEDQAGARLTFLFSPPGAEFQAEDHAVPAGVTYREDYYRNGDRVRPVNNRLEAVGYYIHRVHGAVPERRNVVS